MHCGRVLVVLFHAHAPLLEIVGDQQLYDASLPIFLGSDVYRLHAQYLLADDENDLEDICYQAWAESRRIVLMDLK